MSTLSHDDYTLLLSLPSTSRTNPSTQSSLPDTIFGNNRESPLPSPQEGTAQHKMPSNRENGNGGRGRGSHATVTHLSPKAKKMLSYGLSLVGFGKKRQKCWEALSIRRFRAHYDIGPGAVEQLASDLKKNYDEPINLPNLFMALHWLKLYSTKEVMAGRWGHGE